MIDVLPSPHSAIFTTPRRRMSPSLVWGIAFALGVHGLLAFYLLSQSFAPVEETPVAEPRPAVVTMERPLPKPLDPPKPQNVIKVHTPTTVPTALDTTPIIPVKGPDVVIEGPLVLPTVPEVVTDPGTAPPAPPAFVEARWTRFPDAGALARYYPPRAIEDDKAGTATVECTVLDDAGHVSCAVISETPRTYGFGKATAAMIASVGRVDTTQGNVRPGSVLRKSVTWALDD